MKITQAEIQKLEKKNELVRRIDILDIFNEAAKERASVFKILLQCDMLTEKGVGFAEEHIKILEKYNSKKAAS